MLGRRKCLFTEFCVYFIYNTHSPQHTRYYNPAVIRISTWPSTSTAQGTGVVIHYDQATRRTIGVSGLDFWREQRILSLAVSGSALGSSQPPTRWLPLALAYK
jgi:hypothetical protein